jgi:EAL domain-containing protein (putative c-di-GMP-specific phosphodiesterase class I)
VTGSEVEAAIEAGEIFLLYQPKLDLRTGAICGAEALARWRGRSQSEVDPSVFIPKVEACGAIDLFSEWAIATAARQWTRWRAKGVEIDLAVNISALNLKHVRFPDLVTRICAEAGLPTERLTLELTEGATQESTRLMDTIARFRLKGIGISLDDFGTGYGSLCQLRMLPFTELKIDRSFVSDLPTSRDSRAITRGLIQIAHELGLGVTAEGVEDAATLEALAAFGCDRAQGFHIAKPMAGERIVPWLRGRADAAVGEATHAQVKPL